jgi:hypothetical protein
MEERSIVEPVRNLVLGKVRTSLVQVDSWSWCMLQRL